MKNTTLDITHEVDGLKKGITKFGQDIEKSKQGMSNEKKWCHTIYWAYFLVKILFQAAWPICRGRRLITVLFFHIFLTIYCSTFQICWSTSLVSMDLDVSIHLHFLYPCSRVMAYNSSAHMQYPKLNRMGFSHFTEGILLQHLEYEISHFSKGYWLRRTRFISYRDFQRFLRSDLPLEKMHIPPPQRICEWNLLLILQMIF